MKRVVVFVLVFSIAAILSYLIAVSAKSEQSIIGGRPALKGEFPEIVYIRSGMSRCSATVVGPQVILTAAHCVPDQGSIGPVGDELIDFVVDQAVYRARCLQAPLYRDDIEDHDMALCKVDKNLDIQPASISKKGPKIGESVILTGYGCTSKEGGGNDGILRVGKAKVTRLPGGIYHWFDTEDKTALCFGDSGGPSLLNDEKKHLLIGVNSRGDIEKVSLMTALFTEESLDFMRNFADEQKVDICGISKNC